MLKDFLGYLQDSKIFASEFQLRKLLNFHVGLGLHAFGCIYCREIIF